MHFPATENPDATLPPNAWNLQRIPGTTELPATHTGPAQPCQPLLYCSQSSPVYSGAQSATSLSLSFHLLKAHLLKDVLYSGPQKPLSLTGAQGQKGAHQRGPVHVRNHYKGAGCRLERHQVPQDLLSEERCTPPRLAGLKVGRPLLAQEARWKPPCKTVFLTQKHLLIQNAFIRVNDHHRVEDRWLLRMEAEPIAKKGGQSHHLMGAPRPMFQTARPVLEHACQQGSILCSLPIPRPFSWAISSFLGVGNRPSCLSVSSPVH